MKVNEQTESTFVKKFAVGPTILSNVLINPTLEEAKEYGLGYITEEPNYIGKNDQDVPKVDIVVYGKVEGNPDIILSQKYTIVGENMISQTQKTCYINQSGKTSWVEKEEDLSDRFKEVAYRKMLRGEEQFYNFILSFNNTKFDEVTDFEVTMEDYKKIFAGDFSELKLFNQLPGNKWQWLAYVDDYNDKLYNKVYRYTFKHWETTPYLYNFLEKKGSKVEWSEYIDFIVNTDVNNRFNPVYITNETVVLTLDELKAKLASNDVVNTPVVKEPTNQLPF